MERTLSRSRDMSAGYEECVLTSEVRTGGLTGGSPRYGIGHVVIVPTYGGRGEGRICKLTSTLPYHVT